MIPLFYHLRFNCTEKMSFKSARVASPVALGRANDHGRAGWI
jgi:hypothetical protein